MARKRMISPSFFKHHELYQAERQTGLPLRIAFEALWCQSDRRGLFKWKPVELKLECLPYDDVDFSEVLGQLQDAGFVECYEVGGKRYGRIPTFLDHQSFHVAEKPDPTIPEPPSHAPEPTSAHGQHSASTVQAPDRPGVSTPVTIAVAVTDTVAVASTTVAQPVERSVGPMFETAKAELLAVCDSVQALAFETLLRSHPDPDTLVANVYAVASGQHQVIGETSGRKADVVDVVKAVCEMAANGQQWSVRLFRGYVRKIVDRPAEPSTAEQRKAAKMAADIEANAKIVGVIEPPRSPEEKAAAAVRVSSAMAHFRQLAARADVDDRKTLAKYADDKAKSPSAPLAGIVSQVVAQATG